MITFEELLDGVTKYVNNEIIPTLNDWQEIMVRVALGRIFENRENVKKAFVNNGIVRTFGVIDDNGNVDITRIAEDIKKEVMKKQKVTVDVPMLGKMTFYASDIDRFMNYVSRKTEDDEVTS